MNQVETTRKLYKNVLTEIANGNRHSFAPLTTMFGIGNQKVMTLEEHYQLLPMYATVLPPRILMMLARQLGKSTNACASNVIRSSVLPFYNSLILEPRFEQIQRFNAMTYRPLLESCTVCNDFITNTELERLAIKKYKNGSLTLLSHLLLSPSKIRGCSSVAMTYIDETQDINRDFIPVVIETMSATKNWGTLMMTGTPLTTDTTLGLEWEDSSQAEWVIKCPHCNYYNIPNPQFDIEKMIGKHGCICAGCGRPLNPIHGAYIHAFPDRQFTYPGYHLSQTVHPMHCMHEEKWPRLLYKVEHYSEALLYNEVFGWPYDTSVVPLTRKNILDSRNNHNYASYEEIPSDLKDTYRYIVIGIDWDGGGCLSMSFTNIAVCGLRRDSNKIDCIYGERIKKGQRARDVASHVMAIVNAVGPDAIAYDAGGAGFLYRQCMIDAGINDAITLPFKYSSPSSGDVINFHPGHRDDNSYYYTIDKSRSLAILIETVKNGAVTNPWFDEKDMDAEPLELLSLIEMPKETSTGETIYLIGRKSSAPDDYAHALNFACSSIWDHFKSYPRLGERYNTDLIATDKPIPEDEPWGDPGDIDLFISETNGPVYSEGGF